MMRRNWTWHTVWSTATLAALMFCCLLTTEAFSQQQALSATQNTDKQTADAPPPTTDTPISSNLQVTHISIAAAVRLLESEMGLSADEARQWLLQHAATIIGCEPEKADGQYALGYRTGDERRAFAELPVDSRGCGVRVDGDLLTFAASPTSLIDLMDSLKTLEAFGVAQVQIRTFVFRDRTEAIQRLPIRWSFGEPNSKVAHAIQPAERNVPVSTASEIQASNTSSPEASPSNDASDSTLVVPVSHSIVQRHTQRGRLPESSIEPPPGVTSPTWTEASSIVERSSPVLFTLMTPAERSEIMAELSKSKSVQTIMTPTVMVYNGQLATVQSIKERPFITSVNPVVSTDARQPITYVPSIRVYPDGTKLSLLPKLIAGKTVRLKCELQQSAIRKVDTMSFPHPSGTGELTVQIPEVTSNLFRTSLDLPLNYSLAISTTDEDAEGQQWSTLVICQCSVSRLEDQLAPRAVKPTRETAPARKSSEPKRLTEGDASELKPVSKIESP